MHETQFHYQKGYKPTVEQQKKDKLLIDKFVAAMKALPETLPNQDVAKLAKPNDVKETS